MIHRNRNLVATAKAPSTFCRVIRILIIALLGTLPLPAKDLKVAALHPLLGDLARHIAGNRAVVVDLIGPTQDPHHFEPRPENLKLAAGSTIYLAAGMGLEGYLPKLRATIGDSARVVEIGASLPGLAGQEPEIDPHWWHSIERFRRAANVVADVLGSEDPGNAAYFAHNAVTYRTELDELERWARREISKIPRDNRHLATTHAAFGYFCADFGFAAHPIEGLNHEQSPDAGKLAEVIGTLKRYHVAAIFPEKESNPKIMAILTADTGIRLAEPLIADGTGGLGYVAMYRHNVEAIVKALAQ